MITIIKRAKKYVIIQNGQGQKYTVKDWVSFWEVNIPESDLKALLGAVKHIFTPEIYAKLKEKIAPTPKQKKEQIARTRAANAYFLKPNRHLDKLEKEMQADPGFCPWIPDREYGKSLVDEETARLIRF